MEQKDNVEFTSDSTNVTQKVFNLIILDESGSMQMIESQAVSGLNETFQTISNAQKEHQEQQHFISFVTFNTHLIKTVMNRQPVDSDVLLEWSDYHPMGCTPLFDAMGLSLTELRKHVGNEDVVLVTIITDGMENASYKYSGANIKELVADLKEKGWVFAYIGTNQDVDAVADSMGIRSRMHYDYSPLGARKMFDQERSSKERFFARLHREGSMFMMDDSYDYFHPGNEDKKVPRSKTEKESELGQCIVGDQKDDNKAPSQDDSIQNNDDHDSQEIEEQQDSTGSYINTDEKESAKGFWGKLKDYLFT